MGQGHLPRPDSNLGPGHSRVSLPYTLLIGQVHETFAHRSYSDELNILNIQRVQGLLSVAISHRLYPNGGFATASTVADRRFGPHPGMYGISWQFTASRLSATMPATEVSFSPNALDLLRQSSLRSVGEKSVGPKNDQSCPYTAEAYEL